MPVERAEQRPVGDAGKVEPSEEVAQGAGGGVGAVGDADPTAGGVLVGPGAADGDGAAFVAFLEVGGCRGSSPPSAFLRLARAVRLKGVPHNADISPMSSAETVPGRVPC